MNKLETKNFSLRKYRKEKKMKNYLKRTTTFFLALLMLVSVPLQAFAETKVNHNDIAGDKAKFVNKLTPVQIARPDGKAEDFVKDPAQPAIYTLRTDYKAEKGEKYSVNYQPYLASVGEKASDAEKAKVNKEIKLPDMAGYKKPNVESFTNSYDAIVDAAKVGHQTDDDSNGLKYLALREYKYTATTSNITVKHVFQNMEDFNKYTNKDGTITKNDGTVIGKDGTETKFDLKDPAQKEKYQAFVRDHENLRILQGNTGSTLEVQALQESERPGFVPQVERLKTQVPEDTSDFKIEYRYNRAAYDVVFDTADGTPLPTRTYYYDQEIPKIDENSIPTKEGCEFLGWMPSHDLEGMLDGKKHIFKKNEIIKDSKNNAIVDLGNTFYKKDGSGKFVKENGDPVKEKLADDKEIQLKMPALKLGDGKNIPREKLTFTAVWKDKEKADFAVQFWAEKADHADNASILDKYDYMGTKVYNNIDVGFQPYLKDMPVNDIKFPDLDKTRLQKIWNGDKFNRGRNLYLNKFFVYNKDLTDKENADTKNPIEVKKVSATGKTVYNIYYDRQVYDLYFTKSNAQPEKNTIYPEIWGYNPAKGESVMLGGPGKPYHYKARFNEMMYKWPNDAKQTKGFTPGYQSFGWGPNYDEAHWPLHLDTPPYRLNADEFLDMANYDNWGGYTKHIDKGDGNTMDLDRFDFRTLSFGIKQDHPSIPHHMDFWMDGFKDGETIIRYDLVRTKADTAGLRYGHKYPIVTGFTPYGYNPRSAWPTISEGSQEDGRVDEDRIDDLNDERGGITLNTSGTYYNNNGIKLPIGQLDFIQHFFSDSDDFGDLKEGGQEFTENGYLQFKYTRNKYPLRFNYDPTKVLADNQFTYPIKDGTGFTNQKANALETFYEFPLKCLSPDVDKDEEYKKVAEGKNPQNLLDDANNLYKLGLYDLLQRDKDNPNKFFQDAKGNYRVKRPEGLSDQMVFKGWALDPAGKKMVWKNPKETMPFHPANLYAIWDDPDASWKVTVDPNGGELSAINLKDLTTEEKTIKEGDIGKEEENTYPVKGYKGKELPTGDKNKAQVFTVAHKQKLKELPKPTRYGYDFLGWEVIHYKKDGENYTNEQDTSYRDKYKVPELYSFGTDVVAPIYLKAIWVENKRAEVKVYHYYLKNEKTDAGDKFVLDTSKYPNPEKNTLAYKRVDDYVPATGEKQDEHWILAANAELMEKLHGTYKENGTDVELKPEYEAYNNRVKLNNTYFQTFRVQDNINVGNKDNPVYKPNPENVFRFYYRPFRTRNYKVNYIDERGKAEVEKFFKDLDLTDTSGLTGDGLLAANNANKKKYKDNRKKLEDILNKYKVIDKEDVTSECRHYDARNYRHIPGWKLVGDPQQQLFYDVNEDTNEFLGINGTGSNEIYFYYKDARVIEVKNPKDPVPDGYVRVTFKIDDKNKGGVFKDKDNKEATELYYDVIKGLKSDNLPNPVIWEDSKDDKGNDKVKEANRYYITPDQGKSFKGWDNEKWLNAETEINKNYTFTAYFDWSGLSTKAEGLVRTEAYKDPNIIEANPADPTIKAKDWSNNFAPTIEDLKKQLVWKEKDEAKDNLPEGTDIKLVYKAKDGTETELKTDEDVFNLVKEMGKEDKDEVVRVVNIVAKVTFKDGKQTQELPIPITVYKNRYEALNINGDKPEYLSNAEKKPAKEGGLKDVTGNYVKVTVSPTGDMKAKDNKVYYVNPKAWVEIPEVKADGSSTFINWTADQVGQNDDGKEKGKFDFAKRHKFTKDTIITPVGAKDVVEQEKGKDKPDVPKTYVKVIVKTTDKATDETAFEKTFWVNPEKEVAITVDNPKGKENQEIELKDGNGKSLGKKKVNYNFNKWQIVKTGEDDTSLTDLQKPTDVNLDKQKYTSKVTVIEAAYKNEIQAEKPVEPLKTTKLDTPEGKEITDEILKGKITPQAGKEIESIEVISKPDGNTVGNEPAKVIVKYKDGSTQGTNDNPVVIPVEVHKNIIPEVPGGQRPKEALDNYVKVIFKAGTGGKVSGDLVYYVSPEVEVDMTDSAGKVTKIPSVGYTSNGGTWSPEIKAEKIESEKTYVFNFVKSEDIVEKTDKPNQTIPEGYVKVTFKTDGNGKVNGKDVIIYYVNPTAEIKLGKTATADNKTLVVPTPTANEKFVFKEWQEAIDETTPITSERVHVAIFKPGQVTLTYNKGGNDVTGDLPSNTTVNYGETVGLGNKGNLAKPNAEFAGWKLDNDETIYQPGAQVKLEKARTATAQWTTSKHTVKFILTDGAQFAEQEVEHGKTATNPGVPKLDGKVFMGWKENASDENYFDFANTAITTDKTLIAIWQDPVQKIGENDTVDTEKFIKVTFKQGAHGTLEGGEVTYKVEKGLSFEEAKEKGLKVPEIKPANYYKVKADNKGWNQALALAGQDVTFTAQYELVDNVIPVDKNKDNETLIKEKPNDMVLVTFEVNTDKAYMMGDTKFYVKRSEIVNITPPLVLAKDPLYVFKGWGNFKTTEGKIGAQFDAELTEIKDSEVQEPKLTITMPRIGRRLVYIEELVGETGKLKLTSGTESKEYSNIVQNIRGEDFDVFKLDTPLKRGDIIEYWAENSGRKSLPIRITME